MAFRLDVDHTNKIIMLTIDGELTDQTLLAGYAALGSCFEHYGACDCIVDYTGLTKVAITTQGIRYLADRRPIFPMDCLVLNIAPEDAMYGMARMFQILSSDSRPNFRVVHTMGEALKLIGVKSPTFMHIAPAQWQPTLDRERAA